MKRIFYVVAFSLLFFHAYSQAPVANFTASVTTLCGSGAVTFTDISANSPDQWFWTFGDATTSNIQHPVKFYSTPGTFTVSLTATNATGSDVEVKTGLIVVYVLPN